jgi:hypothetical protein
MKKTGWPPGLLQDDCSKLSRWFASRIDARETVRRVFRQEKGQDMTQDEIIEIAKLSGWEMDNSCVISPQVLWYIYQEQLEAFAKLVEAKERARCSAKAEIALLGEHIWTRDRVLKAIQLEDEE